MTTREPGASEVFTQGLHCRPASTALRASRPAAIITEGLDVLVQLVIAAMTTDPCVTRCCGARVVQVLGWGFEDLARRDCRLRLPVAQWPSPVHWKFGSVEERP